MKYTITLLAVLALPACTTGSTTSAVDTACNNLPIAQTSFVTFTVFKPQSAAVLKKEQLAYDVATAACATRTASTLSKVNAALAVIAEIQG